MEEKRLQTLIEEMWPRLKKKHLYPEIPIPKVGRVIDSFDEKSDQEDSNQRVGLEMKEKQMTINPAFIASMKDKMSEENLIEALLDHGITHYTFCPWDFQTHLMLYAEAKKVLGDKESAKRAANYFIDVIADTHCVKMRETEIPELHRNLKKGNVEKVIASLYQRIWGIDMGLTPSQFESRQNEEVVRRLARIPYLDRSRWTESIRKFARSLKPLLILEEKEKESRGGGKGDSNPQGEHNLNHYSYEEIDEGLREYAQKTMGLSEFREVVEDFSSELKEMGYGIEAGMGRGRGAPIDADILFYMKLAEHYSIPLKKIPMEEAGTLHPHSHSPWEVGSPFQDIDVWTSFGKIMPGITQVWKKREGKGRGKVEEAPDCLIIIDSSGSMINPRKSLSYAVLGAACATNAYLKNDSKVAVYNFSDAPMGGREILDYTENKNEIYRTLCRYFGGGTALDLEDMMPLIKKEKKVDLFIITDMKITNLETLIGFFGKIQNRITAVHIGENPYASRFEKAVEKKKNINIFTVKKKEDIPHIVLGSIRQYFNTMQNNHSA